MSDIEEAGYFCSACGANNFRGLVQYGSYILRCRSCGTYDAATSYMAIGPSDVHVQAVVVDDDWNVLEIVAEGSGEELYHKVRAAADKGKLVTFVRPGTLP